MWAFYPDLAITRRQSSPCVNLFSGTRKSFPKTLNPAPISRLIFLTCHQSEIHHEQSHSTTSGGGVLWWQSAQAWVPALFKGKAFRSNDNPRYKRHSVCLFAQQSDRESCQGLLGNLNGVTSGLLRGTRQEQARQQSTYSVQKQGERYCEHSPRFEGVWLKKIHYAFCSRWRPLGG